MSVRLLGLVALLTFAHAHSGFDTLAWQQQVGAYQLTVLGDFHTSDAGQARLFVQLSEGRDAAPADTVVSAAVSLRGEAIYRGGVPFVGTGSTNGTFYRGFLLELPLSERGVYDVDLSVSGPLGAATTSYAVRSQQTAVPPLEYLPSALILVISIGGTLLLFVPLARKDPMT